MFIVTATTQMAGVYWPVLEEMQNQLVPIIKGLPVGLDDWGGFHSQESQSTVAL